MNDIATRTALAPTQPSNALRTGADIVATSEIAATAVAAQAKAMVLSRYEMALRHPRDWDKVRQDTLKECRRPAFAHNKSAFYRKPIGQGVEGLGIRFVEVALRCMTNVLVETTMIYEDVDKEVHRVSVTDLESNITYPLDVRVSKTVERSKAMDDGSYISVRMNSYGKPVYTVPSTDDDLLNKRAALISKAVRTLGLRVIPGDIQDEAEEIIKEIRQDAAAKDPDGERKKIADAFASIGVKVEMLVDYLGHDLGTCSPNELVDLRGIYGAIKDGEASWQAVVDNQRTQAAATKKPAADGGNVEELNAGARAKATTKKADQPTTATKRGGPSYAEVESMIGHCKTDSQLNDARALFSAFDGEEHDTLVALADKRMAELAK